MSMLPYGDEIDVYTPCATPEEQALIGAFASSQMNTAPEYYEGCVFFDQAGLAAYPERMEGEDDPDCGWTVMECYEPAVTPVTIGLYEEPEWRDIGSANSLKAALEMMLEFYSKRKTHYYEVETKHKNYPESHGTYE